MSRGVPWKVDRDRYLREVARRWGEAAVWEAGFFADDDDTDAALDDVAWLCTPVAHVVDGLRALASSPRGPAATSDPAPVVLVATGGFWPPHRGHLQMLERARAALDDAGHPVVGGYVSPGHDQYLRLKWGAVAPPATARIAMLDEFVAGTGWLAVDPWESLHRRTSVNFTDVVARLEAYLHHHVDERIEVAFVCGGDNARFSLAFAGADAGRCVVVGRAPYVLPYVDPHARCGAEPADVLVLSIDVWHRNAEAYAGTGRTVADLPDPARRVVVLAGHDLTAELEAVCHAHAERLAALLPFTPTAG